MFCISNSPHKCHPELVTFSISHLDSHPVLWQPPCPLATALSLATTLPLLSSRAKPRDLQFHSHQPQRQRKRTADPSPPPDFLSRVAASVNCMWFSLRRTTSGVSTFARMALRRGNQIVTSNNVL